MSNTGIKHIYHGPIGDREVKAGSISYCGHKLKATKGVNYDGPFCGACMRRLLEEFNKLRWSMK